MTETNNRVPGADEPIPDRAVGVPDHTEAGPGGAVVGGTGEPGGTAPEGDAGAPEGTTLTALAGRPRQLVGMVGHPAYIPDPPPFPWNQVPDELAATAEEDHAATVPGRTDLAAPSDADARGEAAGSNADLALLRPMQGGADGLPDAGPAPRVTYGDLKYEDGEGPYAGHTLSVDHSAGLSGTPQADAGNTPANFNDDQTPQGAPGPQT